MVSKVTKFRLPDCKILQKENNLKAFALRYVNCHLHEILKHICDRLDIFLSSGKGVCHLEISTWHINYFFSAEAGSWHIMQSPPLYQHLRSAALLEIFMSFFHSLSGQKCNNTPFFTVRADCDSRCISVLIGFDCTRYILFFFSIYNLAMWQNDLQLVQQSKKINIPQASVGQDFLEKKRSHRICLENWPPHVA